MPDTTIAREARGYESRIRFSKPARTVFDALTTLTGLAGWWSPATGSGIAGGRLCLDHNHHDPLVLSVSTADPPVRVVWTVLDYPLNPEWVGSRIHFQLRADDRGGSVLDFQHEGLTPELECYDHCSRGWDQFLPSLSDFVETGTGRPLAK